MSERRERSVVAVVTAIPEEFEAVVGAARDVRRESSARVRARIGPAEVVIAMTGDGPRNAESAAFALCSEVRPSALVGAGIAGGLTPQLAALDVVASARVLEDGSESSRPDASLVRRAERAGARAATFVTVRVPVLSPAQRRALASALDGGPAAVDMESAAWARAASRADVPYVVLRAVTDAADETLPEFLSECLGSDGGIRRSAVVLRALFRPASWPDLLRMRRRARDGAAAVAAAVARLLSEPL